MYTLPSNAVASSIYLSGPGLTSLKYLDTTKDIVVSFDYACYGTAVSGAEGFCVFFSSTQNPTVNGGGPGPGLVYSSVSGVNNTTWGGLDSGVLGVGFDLTGNFGSNNFFNSGYSNNISNSIAIRSSYGSKYNIITRTPNLNDASFGNNISLYQQITSTNQNLDYKRVRVRLTDFGQRIVVDIKNVNDLNFTNYLNYSFTNYNNSILSSTNLSSFPVTWPLTVRCGLGFANGTSGDTRFKIKGFNVNGVISLSAALGTYTYDVDTTTLSATQNYTNPAAPYFFYGDTMNVQNTTDGVLGDVYNTSLSAASATLILVTPGIGNSGAPYQSGDKYIKVTQHS